MLNNDKTSLIRLRTSYVFLWSTWMSAIRIHHILCFSSVYTAVGWPMVRLSESSGHTSLFVFESEGSTYNSSRTAETNSWHAPVLTIKHISEPFYPGIYFLLCSEQKIKKSPLYEWIIMIWSTAMTIRIGFQIWIEDICEKYWEHRRIELLPVSLVTIYGPYQTDQQVMIYLYLEHFAERTQSEFVTACRQRGDETIDEIRSNG